MTTIQTNLTQIIRNFVIVALLLVTFSQCSEEGEMISPSSAKLASPDGLPISEATALVNCASCTYMVPPKTHVIDGEALGLKPGDVICLNAATTYTTALRFINLKGTAAAPIVITNCGGTATVTTGGSFVLKTERSQHFKIAGSGPGYGIKITGASLGITLDYLSTNFEVDHVEVHKVGFAGIMAKTDPTCDNNTNRGDFIMRDVSFHDNYIHDTGGEAFYVGNSFYLGGMKRDCGQRFPHDIEGVKIYNNVIKNSGWEAIQLGSAPKGAEVYNNSIENFGYENKDNQRNGIQIGEGTGGKCYNNFIKNGKGNGIVVLGYGDNMIYNNIIINAGLNGIFCDERHTPGPGFQFINNTIINPAKDGIRLYADQVEMNVVKNNVIVNPGSYGTYHSSRNPEDSYIYKLSKDVKVEVVNNFFTRTISEVKFTDANALNFRLLSSSPLINQGASVSSDNIPYDFYQLARVRGNAPDIGASEF